MSEVKRFSLEERYGYQNRKVIYDKNSDNDIELNNIYPIIDLFNQLDEQILDLQHRLAVAEKALELAVEYLSCDVCPYGDGMNYCYKAAEDDEPPADEECKNYIASYFKQQAEEMLEND